MKSLVILSFLSLNLFAYTIGIYTDEAGGAKARQVINEMSATYPFSILDIEYEIIPQTTEQLDCGFRTPGIDRLPTCNSGEQRNHARRNGIDQPIIIMDHERYGGSGGGIPVMTTAAPPATMMHEYLHTLGLCDEYEYSQSEADYYCPYMENKENVTLIRPRDNYESDNRARRRHYDDIKWYAVIASTTPITNGGGSRLNLGTTTSSAQAIAPRNLSTSPTTVGSAIGLYRGRTACKNASRPFYLWHPGQERNVMENLDMGLGRANEVIVTRLLLERGANYLPEHDPERVDVVLQPEVNTDTTDDNFDSKSLFERLMSNPDLGLGGKKSGAAKQ